MPKEPYDDLDLAVLLLTEDLIRTSLPAPEKGGKGGTKKRAPRD